MKVLNSRIAVLALAAMLTCGFAAVSEAAFYGPGNGPAGPAESFDGPGDGPFPGYGANLNPDQMAAAQQIFNENYARMDETRKALASKRAELNAELDSANPDKAKIESLSTEIGQLRGKMLSARADVRAQLQKEGLPTNLYGPKGPRPTQYGPYPGWGCPGMMMNFGCPGAWQGPYHRNHGHGHGHGGWQGGW